MFSVFLKPLLGLLTIGGLGTGGYFLYKNIQSKKSEKANEKTTVSEGIVGSNLGERGGSGEQGQESAPLQSPRNDRTPQVDV